MALFPDEKQSLVKHFSGRSRKASLTRTNRLQVAKKYDNKGKRVEPSENGLVPRRHVFDLSIKEASFLKVWKENDWDFRKAVETTMVKPWWAKHFVQSLDARNYRQEDERDEILAQIPTKTWITARYTAASIGLERPTEEQKWGIQGAERIVMPKGPAVQITNNILNMPKLTPEQEAQLRSLGDSIATTGEDQKVA